MTLTEKLWLTEDRKTVVKDGDKRAAFLIGVPGTVISDLQARRLGLLKSAIPEDSVEKSEKHSKTLTRDTLNPDPPVAHRDAPHTSHPHKK